MNDFYVGYLPNAPEVLGRFVRQVIAGLALLSVVAAVLLVLEQRPFANSTFEYGRLQTLEGSIAIQPYPELLVERPGENSQRKDYSRYLLVAPGKHGADQLLAGFEEKQVRLKGQLIYRDRETMVEVSPGSITILDGASEGSFSTESARDLGPVTVTGEIVDSKCYLGVMNPGQGKVHRDCAARCLSGGIPPIFVSLDGRDQYLLTDRKHHALDRDVLREFIAEPITIQGEVLQRGDRRLLAIDAGSLRHSGR